MSYEKLSGEPLAWFGSDKMELENTKVSIEWLLSQHPKWFFLSNNNRSFFL